MGDDSVAENKWENGRRVDFVGWEFNLDTRMVSLSQKNHYKAVYYFFIVDVHKPQSLHTMQALASRATRYSTVCRHMKPYTAAFYTMTTLYKSPSAMRVMSKVAALDVLMWRAFLCLLAFDEKNYARPIESFRPQSATFRLEYDASLTGLGLVISHRSSSDSVWMVLQYVGMLFPFCVDSDSSFQNTCEYLAIIAGVYVLYLLGYCHFEYEIVGDSMSSLKWSRTEYTKSSIARNASIGLSLLAIRIDAQLNSAVHIAGKANVVCDRLSRDPTYLDDTLRTATCVSFVNQRRVLDYLSVCDPTVASSPWSDQHIILLSQFLTKLT
jgi:hypothetical protein